MHQEISQAIKQASKIVITSHKSPDGDSIGSSMAMYQWLKKQNKSVQVVHPDPAPEFLKWIEEIELIVDFETNSEDAMEALAEADLIFALDYNHPSRLGKLCEFFEQSTAKKIMIDHHQHPAEMADITLSDPNCCSTAQLVFDLIVDVDPQSMTAEIGTPVYLGIMTDTGSFRFSSVTKRTHEILAQLIDVGVDHTMIHEAVFDQVSLSQLRMKAFAINNKLELFEDNKVALISLTQKEMEKYDPKKGDTEGLVNNALAIKDVKMAIFAKEDKDAVKISFRSKHEVEVNKFAGDHFEGGGHIYAAGGISYIGMEDTIKKIKGNVGKYL
jgi:phosphoesterase RecJ-like protein